MAQFPYLLVAGFEGGATNFDTAITDTDSKSAYSHYTESVPKYNIVPWRGAYCWTIDQSIGTATNAVYQTHAACNVSADNYWAIGFAFYAKSTTMATTNRTSIVKLVSAGPVDEVCLQLYYTTAAGLQLLLTEANDTAVGSNPAITIDENKWHWIHMYGKVDDGGTNNGTAYLVVDGLAAGNIGSLDQAAITDIYVGLINTDAGHTAGIYAFDDFIISGTNTSAVYVGHRHRFPNSIHVQARSNALDTTGYGEHLFLGPGSVRDVSLLTANAGDMIRFFDTDRGYTVGDYNLVSEYNFSSGQPSSGFPISFTRGCYCVTIPGSTNGARAVVTIDESPGYGYSPALYYGSEENLKNYVAKRKERLGNI